MSVLRHCPSCHSVCLNSACFVLPLSSRCHNRVGPLLPACVLPAGCCAGGGGAGAAHPGPDCDGHQGHRGSHPPGGKQGLPGRQSAGTPWEAGSQGLLLRTQSVLAGPSSFQPSLHYLPLPRPGLCRCCESLKEACCVMQRCGRTCACKCCAPREVSGGAWAVGAGGKRGCGVGRGAKFHFGVPLPVGLLMSAVQACVYCSCAAF